MCNEWCQSFAKNIKEFVEVNSNFLEVGSRDVNGSCRSLFNSYSKTYVGIDLFPGPGVDLVEDVKNLTRIFGYERFDVVISTEMLEHCEDWQGAVYQMLSVLRLGGVLILTTRSPGFELHDYPADYWRFSKSDFEEIFEPVGEILKVESDMTLGWACGVGIALRLNVKQEDLVDWHKSIESRPAYSMLECRGLVAETYPTLSDPDIETKGQIPDEEFLLGLAAMQRQIWSSRDDRARLQQHGLNIIPSNFYSSVPSIAEIDKSFEYLEPSAPYLDCRIFNHDELSKKLFDLIPYSKDFAPSELGDEDHCTSFFWSNGQFSFSDAIAYYSFIRQLRPNTIVEIGAGFSSLIAVEAISKNGAGKLVCIEPFPRPFISSLSDGGLLDLKKEFAQDISSEILNASLRDGDILFIDSTHAVKTGSDVLHIFLRLIPRITKKVFIHVHDIFLPFGMPKNWLIDHHIYWTEQYLLLALLIDNPRTRVLFGSNYHLHFNFELLNSLMDGRAAAGGGSFWFEYDGGC